MWKLHSADTSFQSWKFWHRKMDCTQVQKETAGYPQCCQILWKDVPCPWKWKPCQPSQQWLQVYKPVYGSRAACCIKRCWRYPHLASKTQVPLASAYPGPSLWRLPSKRYLVSFGIVGTRPVHTLGSSYGSGEVARQQAQALIVKRCSWGGAMTQSFGACKKHWHQACKGSMSLQKAVSLGSLEKAVLCKENDRPKSLLTMCNLRKKMLA